MLQPDEPFRGILADWPRRRIPIALEDEAAARSSVAVLLTGALIVVVVLLALWGVVWAHW